jgi:hypothetical protein
VTYRVSARHKGKNPIPPLTAIPGWYDWNQDAQVAKDREARYEAAGQLTEERKFGA